MAKEVTALVPNPPLPAVGVEASDKTSSASGNWRNIELPLKWVAVAYGCGFLTIMFYTARLGIPVLQLIDPVNVWIGMPLAILFYFLRELFLYGKRKTNEFTEALKEARTLQDRVTSGADEFQLLLNALRSILSTLTPGVLPFLTGLVGIVAYFWKSVTDSLLQMFVSGRFLGSKTSQKRFLLWTGRILMWGYTVTAVLRFINVAGVILAIPLACGVYVIAIFPRLPQSLGGGAPMAVELVLSPEALPKTGVFRDWPRAEVPSTPDAVGSANDGKPSIVVPVTMYFRTEQEVYVRNGSGPIIALSSHVIEGIVFNPNAHRPAASTQAPAGAPY